MMLPPFNLALAKNYKSPSQIARVLSEAWVNDNVACPRCKDELIPFAANQVGMDFFCDLCDESFQLKASHKRINKKLTGAKYDKTLEAFEANEHPNLILLVYQKPTYEVTRLVLIKRESLTKDIIVPRKALPETARRAGWQGCYWMLHGIPESEWIELL